MKNAVVALLGLIVVATAASAQQSQGPLVIVGGGDTTPDVVERTIELAGGRKAVVVVLPQASELADAGADSVEMWRGAGAKDVRIVAFKDRAAARAALQAATLIWIPGGDQTRFMKAIAGTGLDDTIRERHRAGVVVGGTSAGAAVMSAVMITGEADLQSVSAGKTVTADGLGLWPDAIVDQHFLRRQRVNRLIAAVLDHPLLVGVGIDEATAVVVRGPRIDVLGRSAVVVIDARPAHVSSTSNGAVQAATDVRLHVLRAGMSWSAR